MWECPKCGEKLDDEFEYCWKCGVSEDTGEPVFDKEMEEDFLRSSLLGPQSFLLLLQFEYRLLRLLLQKCFLLLKFAPKLFQVKFFRRCYRVVSQGV